LRLVTLAIVLVTALSARSAESQYPQWDGEESVEAYAQRVGLEPTKTIDLGNGVMLEMVLIPAGTFTMGTPEPKRVDEGSFAMRIFVGQSGLALSVGVLLVILSFVVARAKREKHRPQVSLRRLLVLALVSGVGLLGGLHWWHSDKAVKLARTEYEAAKARYAVAEKKEKPAHKVTIPTPFYMGKYEVTQEQYSQVMRTNPSGFKRRPDLPVEMVSWDDAQEFCRRVQKKIGERLRLPSEAEWEYACRAGTVTDYHTGDDEASLARAGWYGGNSKGKTHPVGQKEANAFGLYDMHGNVFEWCEDDCHESYEGAPTEGSVWIDKPRGQLRVLRGGCWYFIAWDCRSATRIATHPGDRHWFFGFRLAAVQPR